MIDLLSQMVVSPAGVAGVAFALGAAGALAFTQGRIRSVASAVGFAAGLGLLLASAVTALPKVEVADRRKAADAELARAQAEIAAGYNLDAASALERAETLFREAGARDGQGRVELGRGDLERLQGRLGEARARYQAAAARLGSLVHKDAPRALLSLAQVEAALGSNDAAKRLFAQAIPLFRRFGSEDGEAQARLAQGILARQEAAYGEAVAALEGAASLFARVGDALGQGRATLELAKVSQAQRQNEEALARMAAADAMFRRAHVPFGLALTPFVGAEMAIEDEEREEAHAFLDRTVEVLAGLDEPLAAAGLYLGLSPTHTLAVRGGGDAADLALFPDHHIEARALLQWIGKQMEHGRNQADAVQ